MDKYHKKYYVNHKQYCLNLYNEEYEKLKEISKKENKSITEIIRHQFHINDGVRLFIDELEYNEKVNFQNHYENRIDIDYVIERLYYILNNYDYND